MKKILSIIYVGICYILLGSIVAIYIIYFGIFQLLFMFAVAALFMIMLYLYDKANNNLK